MKQKILCVLVAMIFCATLAAHAAEAPRKRRAPAKICQEPGCGKACAGNSGLVVHMRTHTGERPFACNTCDKRFSQSCNRNRHQNICGYKQADLPVPKKFSCRQCTRTYSSLATLTNHMTIAHARNRTPSPEPVEAPRPAPAARNMPPVVPEIIIAIEAEEKETTFLRQESAGAMLSAEPLGDYE